MSSGKASLHLKHQKKPGNQKGKLETLQLRKAAGGGIKYVKQIATERGGLEGSTSQAPQGSHTFTVQVLNYAESDLTATTLTG